MAETKGSAGKTARRNMAAAGRALLPDAIAVLEADHRQVEGWFEQIKSATGTHKEELALRICHALRMHMQVEEEIFYPAFLEATQDTSSHHEAEIEHERARTLMIELEASSPEDEYFDAKVSVLSEMIKRHVNEEETRDGMFAKARQSDMDLSELGERLSARKAELAAVAQTGAWAGRSVPLPVA